MRVPSSERGARRITDDDGGTRVRAVLLTHTCRGRFDAGRGRSGGRGRSWLDWPSIADRPSLTPRPVEQRAPNATAGRRGAMDVCGQRRHSS